MKKNGSRKFKIILRISNNITSNTIGVNNASDKDERNISKN